MLHRGKRRKSEKEIGREMVAGEDEADLRPSSPIPSLSRDPLK